MSLGINQLPNVDRRGCWGKYKIFADLTYARSIRPSECYRGGGAERGSKEESETTLETPALTHKWPRWEDEENGEEAKHSKKCGA